MREQKLNAIVDVLKTRARSTGHLHHPVTVSPDNVIINDEDISSWGPDLFVPYRVCIPLNCPFFPLIVHP
jgi:hypothetical protein